MDAVPVMTALAAFGLKHLAGEVFVDGRSRTLSELFPGQAAALLGELAAFARGNPVPPTESARNQSPR